MPSVREIKCPVCGAENGPCMVENGIEMYHQERKKAAYPTTYEHPDCEKCRKLKDEMVYARDAVSGHRPDFGPRKPKSKWPKSWRESHDRLEEEANLARAEYYIHLGADHKDEAHLRDLGRNLEIKMRKGRLKP